MAIVYQHRKPGHLEPFYIGWGTKKHRAYSKVSRNPHWKSVVTKYGYEVDILISGCTDDEAKVVEVGLIAEYGRLDLGTGILVNMTDGGEGVIGLTHSKESKKKIFHVLLFNSKT